MDEQGSSRNHEEEVQPSTSKDQVENGDGMMDKEIVTLCRQIDATLESKAESFNMSALNVKSLLHHLIKNPSVISVLLGLKQGSEGTEADIPSVRLTRSRTKVSVASTGKEDKADSGPHLVPRTSRTFLNVDYPEDDESDDEYDPEKDPEAVNEEAISETDNDLEETMDMEPEPNQPEADADPDAMSEEEADQTLRKSQRVSSRLSTRDDTLGLEFDDDFLGDDFDAAPCMNTRLQTTLNALNSTAPVESLDQQRNDLFDGVDNQEILTHVDRDYLDFVRTLQGSPCVDHIEESSADDDPDDPDYNLLAEVDDPEDLDADDLRNDRTTEIPVREVQAMLLDLFADDAHPIVPVAVDSVNSTNGKRSEEEAVPKKRRSNRRSKPYVPPVDDRGSCTLLGKGSVTFTPAERLQLDVQLQMHVQLLMQGIVGCHFEEKLTVARDGYYKMFNELDQLYYQYGAQSHFNILNMPAAIQTCHDIQGFQQYQNWSPAKHGNPFVPRGMQMGYIVPFPRPETCVVLSRSNAVLYPNLVPHSSMISHPTDICLFTDSENTLLALGLMQFGHVNGGPFGKYYCIKQNLLPIKSAKQIRNHMRTVRLGASTSETYKMIEMAEFGEGTTLSFPPEEPSLINTPMMYWEEGLRPPWGKWFEKNFVVPFPTRVSAKPPPRPPPPKRKVSSGNSNLDSVPTTSDRRGIESPETCVDSSWNDCMMKPISQNGDQNSKGIHMSQSPAPDVTVGGPSVSALRRADAESRAEEQRKPGEVGGVGVVGEDLNKETKTSGEPSVLLGRKASSLNPSLGTLHDHDDGLRLLAEVSTAGTGSSTPSDIDVVTLSPCATTPAVVQHSSVSSVVMDVTFARYVEENHSCEANFTNAPSVSASLHVVSPTEQQKPSRKKVTPTATRRSARLLRRHGSMEEEILPKNSSPSGSANTPLAATWRNDGLCAKKSAAQSESAVVEAEANCTMVSNQYGAVAMTSKVLATLPSHLNVANILPTRSKPTNFIEENVGPEAADEPLVQMPSEQPGELPSQPSVREFLIGKAAASRKKKNGFSTRMSRKRLLADSEAKDIEETIAQAKAIASAKLLNAANEPVVNPTPSLENPLLLQLFTVRGTGWPVGGSKGRGRLGKVQTQTETKRGSAGNASEARTTTSSKRMRKAPELQCDETLAPSPVDLDGCCDPGPVTSYPILSSLLRRDSDLTELSIDELENLLPPLICTVRDPRVSPYIPPTPAPTPEFGQEGGGDDWNAELQYRQQMDENNEPPLFQTVKDECDSKKTSPFKTEEREEESTMMVRSSEETDPARHRSPCDSEHSEQGSVLSVDIRSATCSELPTPSTSVAPSRMRSSCRYSPSASRADSNAIPRTPEPRAPSPSESDRLSPIPEMFLSGGHTPEHYAYSRDVPMTPRDDGESTTLVSPSLLQRLAAVREENSRLIGDKEHATRSLFEETRIERRTEKIVNREERDDEHVAYFPCNEELSRESANSNGDNRLSAFHSAPSSEVDLAVDEDSQHGRTDVECVKTATDLPDQPKKRRRTRVERLKAGAEALRDEKGKAEGMAAIARKVASDVTRRLMLRDDLRLRVHRLILADRDPTQKVWDELVSILWPTHPDVVCLLSLLIPPSLVSAELLTAPLRRAYEQALEIMLAIETYSYTTKTRVRQRQNAKSIFKHIQEICQSSMKDEDEMYRRLEAVFASDQLLWSHLRAFCHRLQSKESPDPCDFEVVDLRLPPPQCASSTVTPNKDPFGDMAFETIDDLDMVLGPSQLQNKKTGILQVTDGQLMALPTGATHYVPVQAVCSKPDGTLKKVEKNGPSANTTKEALKWTSDQDAIILRMYNQVDASTEAIAVKAARHLKRPVDCVRERLKFLLSLFNKKSMT